MKNNVVFFIIIFLSNIFLGCAGLAPMEELAIKQGMEVTFPGQESYKDLKNISDPCVIILADKLEIVKVDDIRSNHSKISGKNVFFVSPGQHSFDILRDTGISIGSSSGSGSGGLSVSVSHSDRLKAPYNNIKYTFEKGKSYNLTMSVEKDVPIFSEIIIESELASIEKYKNDLYAFIKNLKFDDTKNIKMYESYLNYSKINHHLLDGKWKYVPVLFHASEDIMIISGNNIDYIFPENPIFPTFAPWKGKIIYNENTIIILWDIKPTVTNPSTTRQVAWYYTVNGDILETKARYGGIAFPDLGGQFKRIKRLGSRERWPALTPKKGSQRLWPFSLLVRIFGDLFLSRKKKADFIVQRLVKLENARVDF